MRSDDRGRKIKLNLAFPRTERGPGRNRDIYKNSTTRRNFGNDDSYIWASLYPRANHLRSYVNPRSLRDFSHFYDNTSPLSLSLSVSSFSCFAVISSVFLSRNRSWKYRTPLSSLHPVCFLSRVDLFGKRRSIYIYTTRELSFPGIRQL